MSENVAEPAVVTTSDPLFDVLFQIKEQERVLGSVQGPLPNPNREFGRAVSLAVTKLQEARFWVFEAINAESASSEP